MSSRNVRIGELVNRFLRLRELVESHFRVFLCTLRLREHIHFFKPLFHNFTMNHEILQSEAQAKNSTQDFQYPECCFLIISKNLSIPESHLYPHCPKSAFLQANWRSVIMSLNFLYSCRFRCLRKCRNLPASCPKNHSSP